LIEVQQNSETTYRLYDYGRPRELHLDQGIAVADPVPFEPHLMPGKVAEGRTILVEGPKFVLERWPGGHRKLTLPKGITGWLVPIMGEGVADGVPWRAGDCLTLEGIVQIEAEAGSDLLFAYPGAARIADMNAL
jgi:mannose-6-phosphate isomerase